MLVWYSIHRRSVDTNLVEIHAEMSELLDKQVYVLNECFKFQIEIPGFTRGSHKLMKSVQRKKKKQLPRKKILMTGRILYGCIRNQM